ncbi:MAG: SH3 domain-containing protein [Candidatus Acidiferrales bacterium]
MSVVRNRGLFMWISVLLLCGSATAQQKLLWQGVVKPEAINVYQSASTNEHVTGTLRQGDAVDVVLQVSVSGSEWCRVTRAGTSEPLGFVLCLNLELGGSSPEQVAHAQQIATQLHPLTVAAPSPAPSAPAQLTNKDVLDLHKAGLPEQVLVAKIKSSQTNFDTSPSQLKELKAAGLADAVILAMVEAPGTLAATNPNPAGTLATDTTVAPSAAHSQPGAVLIHRKLKLEDNTPVHLVLSDNLSSASATTGQTISFEVSEDVLVDALVIIPRGSLAWGTVTEAQAKRRLGRAGHLDVNIDKVRLADGEKVLLSATSHAKGASHTGAMTAGIVVTSLIVWPAAPFFLFMHGHDVTIPKGTKIEAFINGDATLDAANFVPVPK